MSILLMLLACGGGAKGELSTLPNDGSTGDGTEEVVFTIEDAALQLTESGAFLAAGSQSIPGVAQAMEEVSLNGTTVSVSSGAFDQPLPLVVGINPLDLVGTDIEGGAHRDFGAVLAGDYAPADGPVYDALQVHLSEAAIDDLSAVAGSLIDPSFLNPTLQGINPIVDSPDAVVSVGDVSFAEPIIDLQPGPNGLQMAITLTDFVLPIHATIPDGLPFGIDINLDPDIRADAIVLYATVDLSTNGNGKLVVDLKNVSAELQGFDFDTGLLELVDWLVIDDDDIAVLIEDTIASAGPGLGDAITGIVADLDLKTELDLFGNTLTVWPAFDDAHVDSSGIYLSLAIAIDVDGAGRPVPGHLDFPAPTARNDGNALVQVGDALMNRALFEVWNAGALDLELPLDSPETLVILSLFGGSGSGALKLDMGLPPVWIGGDGDSRVQLGDTVMTVSTPGGQYGEEVSFHMFLDAAAAVEIGGDSIGVVLSDANVILVPAGDSVGDPDVAELAEGLQTAFGIAIGAINGMLKFPVTDLLGEGTELPELAMERDPSGTGVAIDVDLGAFDIAGLLMSLTQGTATTTTTP